MSCDVVVGQGASPPPPASRPPRRGRRLDSGNVSQGSLGLQPLSKAAAKPRTDDSIATPSSVHVQAAVALTRDLSDLSGSCCHARTTTLAAGPVVLPTASGTEEWRHAQVLSTPRLPQHPQPLNDDESSYHRPPLPKSAAKLQSSVWMERNEVIEVCVQDGVTQPQRLLDKSRTPLILLLMDPTRKGYELLQLWMDTATDTVRDILQTINRNLVDHVAWKQDYDGLFQVRNNHFSQLIHVLPAGKYEIVPGELWVCKPWSMSSKQTVGYASSCLNHLKDIGILQYRKCSEFGPLWQKVFRTTAAASKMDDTVLVLSKKATQRLYVPGGILKHHHACQFLAFVPPLETALTVADPDLCAQSTASGLSSDSHDGPEEEEEEEEEDEKCPDEEATVSMHTPLRGTASSTVCSAKTKESAYVLRSPLPHRRSLEKLALERASPPRWRWGLCPFPGHRRRASSNTTAHTEVREWESASHSSGVPLLLRRSGRTVDWVVAVGE